VRAHFSLNAMPFTREISVAERWASPIFEEPLGELHHAVSERMSAVLVAPAGTGKTALLRALVARLPEARFRVHYVKVTSLSKRDMCREICHAMGLHPAGSYPTLVRNLQEKFEATVSTDGLRPILIIDEAHDMRPEVLAIIRILTNFHMDSRLVVAVVLAGQPGLERLLKREDLEAVSQRMAHFASLRLVSRTESRDYMEHRLRIAGARTMPFDTQAFDAVYEISRGNLRAIDHLALKALELAARKGAQAVDATLVTEARKKLAP